MAKRGEAGIGTLILFIAMILVAGITTSVLIQTSSTLQSKSLATASDSQDEVANHVIITRVFGADATNGYLSDIYLDMRLGPGSNPLELDLNDTSRVYYYNGTVSGGCNSTVINDLRTDAHRISRSPTPLPTFRRTFQESSTMEKSSASACRHRAKSMRRKASSSPSSQGQATWCTSAPAHRTHTQRQQHISIPEPDCRLYLVASIASF